MRIRAKKSFRSDHASQSIYEKRFIWFITIQYGVVLNLEHQQKKRKDPMASHSVDVGRVPRTEKET